MKRLLVLALVLGFEILLTTSCVEAHIIEKGTLRIAGSSMIAFSSTSYDHRSDVDEFHFGLVGSYFLVDNFDLGIRLRFNYVDDGEVESESYSLGPSATYRFELNDKQNLFLDSFIGLGWSETDYESWERCNTDDWRFLLGVGWEYFFNSNVAVGLGLEYEHVEFDLDRDCSPHSDDTANRWGSTLGISIYF